MPVDREAILSACPIVRRELVALLRTGKAFWMAVATIAGTSLIPLLHWPDEGSGSTFLNTQGAFRAYQWIFFSALLLFVPGISGSAVSSERERGTYDLLLATRIAPLGLVLGKLIAAVTFFLLLIFLTFPMVAVLYLLGGFFLEKRWMTDR